MSRFVMRNAPRLPWWCTSPEVQAFGWARQPCAMRRTEVRDSESPAEAERSEADCRYGVRDRLRRALEWAARRPFEPLRTEVRDSESPAEAERSFPELGRQTSLAGVRPSIPNLESRTPVRPCPPPILFKILSTAQEHQGAHSRARPRSSTPDLLPQLHAKP